MVYAEDFEVGGVDDWRLPDAKERQSLIDDTRSPETTNSAAIDPKVGDAADDPTGFGPQGDAIRIDNDVRLVRSITVDGANAAG